LGNPKAEPGSLQYKGFGSAKIGTEHEVLTQRLMMLERIQATIVDEQKLFMEVDQVEELKTLVETVYPKILAADNAYSAHS